jgi:hypothetical protein
VVAREHRGLSEDEARLEPSSPLASRRGELPRESEVARHPGLPRRFGDQLRVDRDAGIQSPLHHPGHGTRCREPGILDHGGEVGGDAVASQRRQRCPDGLAVERVGEGHGGSKGIGLDVDQAARFELFEIGVVHQPADLVELDPLDAREHLHRRPRRCAQGRKVRFDELAQARRCGDHVDHSPHPTGGRQPALRPSVVDQLVERERVAAGQSAEQVDDPRPALAAEHLLGQLLDRSFVERFQVDHGDGRARCGAR